MKLSWTALAPGTISPGPVVEACGGLSNGRRGVRSRAADNLCEPVVANNASTYWSEGRGGVSVARVLQQSRC